VLSINSLVIDVCRDDVGKHGANTYLQKAKVVWVGRRVLGRTSTTRSASPSARSRIFRLTVARLLGDTLLQRACVEALGRDSVRIEEAVCPV
jgi:hypothetical protein